MRTPQSRTLLLRRRKRELSGTDQTGHCGWDLTVRKLCLTTSLESSLETMAGIPWACLPTLIPLQGTLEAFAVCAVLWMVRIASGDAGWIRG